MSTQRDIAVSYDVSNTFFSLWLDERMNYSCALFEGTDNLEEAQLNKLRWIANAARVQPGHRVLDIGCGWGANMDNLVSRHGAQEAVGVTLSEEQYNYVLSQNIPNTKVACIDYRQYEPATPFDAVTSIGMFEHLATPEEAQDGRSIEVYREYFRKTWEWTKPGAYFGLQSVIGGLIPRNRDNLRDLVWATRAIFPGAISPRIEAIAQAVTPYWEIVELKTRREHYARTCAEWLKRLESRQELVCSRFGQERFDEYRRYLGACVMCFEKGYQSLVQISLRRIDNAG